MLLTSKCRKGNKIGQLFTFSKLEKSSLLLLNHVDFDDACQPKGGFSASAKYTLRFNKGGFACCVDLSMLMVQIRSFWINISCLVHFYYMKHTGILFIQPNLLRDRKDNKFTVTDILLVATLSPPVEGQIRWLGFVICSDSSIPQWFKHQVSKTLPLGFAKILISLD